MRARSMMRLIVLTVLAAAAIAAVATAVPRLRGGAGQAEAQGGASLVLDMDIDNGSGPCDPIDHGRTVSLADPDYKVAVCLTDSAESPAAFNFDLLYNDALNQCVPVDCVDTECLDVNPDANAGATVFSSPNLGTGWDCDTMGVDPPKCDKDPGTGAGLGRAYMSCLTVETPTLPVGANVSAPIAVVSFRAIAAGTDTLTLDNVALFDYNVASIFECAQGAGPCSDGTSTIGAGATPAATATPIPGGTPTTAATETPRPGETPPATAAAGTPKPGETPGPAATAAAATAAAKATQTKTAGATKTPKATPSAEEEGGGGGPNAAVIAGVVVVALIVLGGIGWFAWRRMRAG